VSLGGTLALIGRHRAKVSIVALRGAKAGMTAIFPEWLAGIDDFQLLGLRDRGRPAGILRNL